MMQENIDQKEWNNPANWLGPKLLGLYSSRADSRLWVPKRSPDWGWTLNLGHPEGKVALTMILLGVVGLLVSAGLLAALILRVTVAILRHTI